MSQRPLLMLIHVHRTAGVALRKAMRRTHQREYLYLKGHAPLRQIARDIPSHVRIVHGHVGHGLHRHVDRPVAYGTVVRDPVDRTLSHFTRINALRMDHGCAPMPLDRFLLQDGAGNLQTRMIAGVPDPKLPEDEQLFDQAVENLRSFHLAAPFEELRSYWLALGLEAPNRVVNKWGPRPALTPEQAQVLQSRTKFDRAIYDLVRSAWGAGSGRPDIHSVPVGGPAAQR